MTKQLIGKTAIVTGASSGIGTAIAKELAHAGANVVLAARNIEKLESITAEIGKEENIKKKAFPKKWLIATLSGLVLSFSIYIYEVYFFTFNEINKEFIQEGPSPVTSPTEKYTANAYYEPYGGAAGGVNVWVEVTNNRESNKVQTIYYSDAKSDFSMEWVDEDTLYILNNEPDYPNSNRSITLKVDQEIYHENGLACKSLLMKGDYETCYQN